MGAEIRPPPGRLSPENMYFWKHVTSHHISEKQRGDLGGRMSRLWSNMLHVHLQRQGRQSLMATQWLSSENSDLYWQTDSDTEPPWACSPTKHQFSYFLGLLGPQLPCLNGNCQTGFCANMCFPWGQTFWVYNLFFHFELFVHSDYIKDERRGWGGLSRAPENRANTKFRDWIPKRQNAAGASLLSPAGSISEKRAQESPRGRRQLPLRQLLPQCPRLS